MTQASQPFEKTDFDYRRTFAMTVFGATYTSCVSQQVYRAVPKIVNAAHSRLCQMFVKQKPLGKLANGVSCSILDNAFHSPLVCIPAFFAVTGSLRGENFSMIRTLMYSSWWDSVKATWSLWLPLQTE